MSFRVKLLLAMTLLVAGVSAATLLVTQRKVQATFEEVYQRRFEREADYFIEQQETRLEPIRQRCAALATNSAPLREAIAREDEKRIYELLADLNTFNPTNRPGRLANRNASASAAGSEAGPRRAGMAAGNGQGANPNSRVGLGAFPRQQLFVRALNARGEIIHPADTTGGGQRAGALRATAQRLEKQLAAVQQGMERLGAQSVGFLARDHDTGIRELYEVIVTKIADPDDGRTLGALAVGLPLALIPALDSGEQALNRMSSIKSGLWVEGELHSQTITNRLRSELDALISKKVKPDGRPPASFTARLNGEPQRVFFKLLNPDSTFPPAYRVAVYSLADGIRTEHELRSQIVAFSAVAIFAALVIGLFLAHGLSTPVRELVAAAEEVGGGNFQVELPVRSQDELGRLAASFNEMAAGLAQKERYRTLLNLVADEEIARALIDGNLALGGELREVTVLFCDIRGFTELTGNMPPERVIEMLNEHMTALTRVVKEHNGVLDKFVGDLLMALFGAPVTSEQYTLDAVRCGLRLVQERKRLNETSQYQLEIGLGIATGSVVAGCMGSYNRLNYTVLGERVNLGSRLCDQAAAGQVIIDQATRDRLGDAITVEPLPALNLKGFAEGVKAYQLVQVHSWPEPPPET